MAASGILEVAELVKRYPKSPVNAVDGISFTVDAGEVFGLLGPNGAGKTTTVGDAHDARPPDARAARWSAASTCVRDPVTARAASSRSCRSAATSTARSRSATT